VNSFSFAVCTCGGTVSVSDIELLPSLRNEKLTKIELKIESFAVFQNYRLVTTEAVGCALQSFFLY